LSFYFKRGATLFEALLDGEDPCASSTYEENEQKEMKSIIYRTKNILEKLVEANDKLNEQEPKNDVWTPIEGDQGDDGEKKVLGGMGAGMVVGEDDKQGEAKEAPGQSPGELAEREDGKGEDGNGGDGSGKDGGGKKGSEVDGSELGGNGEGGNGEDGNGEESAVPDAPKTTSDQDASKAPTSELQSSGEKGSASSLRNDEQDNGQHEACDTVADLVSPASNTRAAAKRAGTSEHNGGPPSTRRKLSNAAKGSTKPVSKGKSSGKPSSKG
jgi:hypothetical protein